jgi:hypothetical protein
LLCVFEQILFHASSFPGLLADRGAVVVGLQSKTIGNRHLFPAKPTRECVAACSLSATTLRLHDIFEPVFNFLGCCIGVEEAANGFLVHPKKVHGAVEVARRLSEEIPSS